MPDLVYAIHSFVPEEIDELGFLAGESLVLLEKDNLYNDGWWKGMKSNGKVGIFPSSFVSENQPPTQPNAINQTLEKTNIEDSTINWTPNEVADWIAQIGFENEKQKFIDNHITGSELLNSTLISLKELGIDEMTTRIKLLHAVILLKDRDQGVISAQCFESSKGVLGHSDIQSGLSVNLSHSDDDNDSLYEIESRNLDFSKSNLSSIVIPNDAMHLQGEIAEILNSDEIDEPSNNDIIDMEKENDQSVEVSKEPKHNSHPDGHNDVEIDTDSQSESTIYQSLSSLNLTTGSSIIPIPERGSREDGSFLSSSQRSSNHLNLAISSSPNKSLRPLSIITGSSFKSQPQSPRPTSPLNAINQALHAVNSMDSFFTQNEDENRFTLGDYEGDTYSPIPTYRKIENVEMMNTKKPSQATMDEKLSDDKGRRRSLLGQRITSGMSTLQKKILKKSRSNMLVECPDLEKSKLSGYLNVKLPDELIFHRKKCVLIDQTLYMFKKDSNIPHHALYINHGTEISPTPKSKVNSFQHSVGNLRLSQRPQITQFIADTQLDMVTWIDALVRAPLPIKLRQPLIPIKSLSRSSAVIQEEQLSSLKLLLSGESQKSHLGLKTTSLSTNSSNSDDSTGRVELSQAKFLPVRSEY